jgi:hypothetical protein
MCDAWPEPFRLQALIGNGYCHARYAQGASEFPTGRQSLAGVELPIQNGIPNLPINFDAQIAAANQADMKGHRPATVLRCRQIGLVGTS